MTLYTTEDKIDYIFKELKSQKRARILKTIFRLVVIWFIIYIYVNFIHWLNQEEIMKTITSTISDIAKPITQDLVNDMINNNTKSIDTWNLQNSLLDQLKNNPDLLNKFK